MGIQTGEWSWTITPDGDYETIMTSWVRKWNNDVMGTQKGKGCWTIMPDDDYDTIMTSWVRKRNNDVMGTGSGGDGIGRGKGVSSGS